MKCLVLLLISAVISASALNVNVEVNITVNRGDDNTTSGQNNVGQLKSTPAKVAGKTNTVQSKVSQNNAIPTPLDTAWEKFKVSFLKSEI